MQEHATEMPGSVERHVGNEGGAKRSPQARSRTPATHIPAPALRSYTATRSLEVEALLSDVAQLLQVSSSEQHSSNTIS
jgi:hypothetical protein